MGEFNAGRWLVIILVYYFFLFFTVFYVVQASNDYDINTDARFDDPGFANVNTNFGAVCQGSNEGSAVGFCSLTRAGDETGCNSLPGCSWNVTSEICEGFSFTLCTALQNESTCQLARCEWVVTDTASDASLTDRGSVNSIRTTISFVFGIGADNVQIGLPTAFIWIFSFVFFWIPFLMLLVSLYFILPFFH